MGDECVKVHLGEHQTDYAVLVRLAVVKRYVDDEKRQCVTWSILGTFIDPFSVTRPNDGIQAAAMVRCAEGQQLPCLGTQRVHVS